MGREIEVKFLMNADERTDVEALPMLRAALREAGLTRLKAVYFDTPGQSLRKRGLSLRTRLAGEHLVETLKQETASGIERGEWEKETTRATPDLSLLRQTPFAGLLDHELAEGDLRRTFEVDVERTSFKLLEEGSEIDGAIDAGHIEVEGKKLGVCELELELKTGDKSVLFGLARRLSAQAPLRLSFISKAERGYRLAEGTWGRSAKGSKPGLDAGMTCREAFQAIARTCLHDFMLNEAALETEDEVEAVHQARVAVRRLRAAITLFRPMLADRAFDGLRADLKWQAGLLGEARDLDVFQETWPRLADRVETRRREAHQAFSDALASERSRAFRVDLVAWIDGGQWQEEFADPADSALAGFVTRRLSKRRKRLVSQGHDLEHLDPDARHRIRIDAKKLRYMAEFFVDVPGIGKHPKRFKRFIRSLEDLQEALGAMHDHEVGAEMAAQTAGLSPEEAEAQTAGTKADTREDLAKAIRAHEQLARTQPF